VKGGDIDMAKMLKITQVKSTINSLYKRHRPVMRALGFTKNYRTLYKNDTPHIRGMLQKVRHLVRWEEVDEAPAAARGKRGPGFTVLEKGSARSSKT
jgi:large subunit ribosomal protein L30